MTVVLQTKDSTKRKVLNRFLIISKTLILHPLSAAVLAVLLFVLTITNLGVGMKLFAEKVIFKPGVVEAMGVTPHFDTFKGTLLQQKAVETQGVFPVFGSSEMSIINDYHPVKVFTPETGVTPLVFGQGGYQTIIQTLNLASLEHLKENKIVIFLSPQWFGPGGIPESAFAGNFSPLHAYEVLNSTDLSQNLKRQIAERILQFPGAYKDFPYLKKRLEYEINPSLNGELDQAVNALSTQMEYTALEVIDFVKMIWHIRRIPADKIATYSTKEVSPTAIEWQKLREEAKVKAAELTNDNPFGMDNKFYQKHIVPKLNEQKYVYNNDVLTVSPEYDDLILLMRVLKEKEAQPLFVILPMNGRWYDYSGLKSAQRNPGYQKLAAFVQTEGYPLADFTSKEYEDYYFMDPWHPAWVGWVDIDQKLYEFYRQQ